MVNARSPTPAKCFLIKNRDGDPLTHREIFLWTKWLCYKPKHFAGGIWHNHFFKETFWGSSRGGFASLPSVRFRGQFPAPGPTLKLSCSLKKATVHSKIHAKFKWSISKRYFGLTKNLSLPTNQIFEAITYTFLVISLCVTRWLLIREECSWFSCKWS